MVQPDFEPLDKAIERATARGATDAEAFLEKEVGLSVRVFGGKVEKFAFSESPRHRPAGIPRGRPGAGIHLRPVGRGHRGGLSLGDRQRESDPSRPGSCPA
jgi:hypothetical protein